MFLNNICKNKKWGEICCEHDWILKFAGFFGILWVKSSFGPKKAPKKTTFSKKFHFFNIFLVLKRWVTLLKYNYHKKGKKIRSKSAWKRIFRNLFKKNFFFLSDFLEFLIFFLNLGLNPHIHLFFQLSSCTG
jgi:hypothetical protein